MKAQVKLVWYNEQWNMYVTTDKQTMIEHKELNMCVKKENSGEFRMTQWQTELPVEVYSFGYWYTDPLRRPGHGGLWSSREAIVNPLFNLDLFGIGLNSWACFVRARDLPKFLPEGATVVLETTKHSNDEKNYHIYLPSTLNPKHWDVIEYEITF